MPWRAPSDAATGRGSLRYQGADVRKLSRLSATVPRALSSHRGSHDGDSNRRRPGDAERAADAAAARASLLNDFELVVGDGGLVEVAIDLSGDSRRRST